ncbi:uncharacterized protein LOC114532904 [Dendronephthya gigantea]|uniref:uncharacterized protein LOC114532904 n=1 Tax=Dendronephthya gigantea TaxID=151771 RepID=UPI00106C8728|nr:uncharacterized protein LOC114532904 [Dendronephthya gigantea]
MANEKPQVEHAYDVWHVAKGEKKKLTKVAKKKKFRKIQPWIGSIINHIYWVGDSSETEDEREEKWRSILNHIINVHEHAGHKVFVKCLHGTIERDWIKKGSAAHKKLEEMLTRPRLISAIRKLSKYHQTSGLEAKHALDNLLASKNTYHSYHSLSARLYCSNLHYNENSNRKQATTADGKLRWAISYPKAFKGEKAVAKPLKEKPTYEYVHLILSQVIKLRKQYPTLKKAKEHASNVLPPEPQSLVQQYLAGKERPSKEQVVANKKSRFSKPALPTSVKRKAGVNPCACKGKCATRKCDCRAVGTICDNECKCQEAKCINRE